MRKQLSLSGCCCSIITIIIIVEQSLSLIEKLLIRAKFQYFVFEEPSRWLLEWKENNLFWTTERSGGGGEQLIELQLGRPHLFRGQRQAWTERLDSPKLSRRVTFEFKPPLAPHFRPRRHTNGTRLSSTANSIRERFSSKL